MKETTRRPRPTSSPMYPERQRNAKFKRSASENWIHMTEKVKREQRGRRRRIQSVDEESTKKIKEIPYVSEKELQW